MKGAPPKVAVFETLFAAVKSAGATSILLEYEDMFPFGGRLKNMAAKNAYSKTDIKTILGFAEANDLEVIPLVQTFGHLEFALKLGEFSALREDPTIPQAACPTRNATWDFLVEMIDQVMALHRVDFLHIGCDEVFQLGQCSACSGKLQRLNNDPESDVYFDGRTLFLEHVVRVGEHVRRKYDVTPIIWDDMLRNIPTETLLQFRVGSVVEPMVWVYVEDVYRFVDPTRWAKYAAVFEHAWTAGAFKGAFGATKYLNDVHRHVENQLSWLEVMNREDSIRFRGLTLTGWSRYNHFAVLCELLPASMPSLIINLAVLKHGAWNEVAQAEAWTNLACDTAKSPISLADLERNQEQLDFHFCRFPGSNFFPVLQTYHWTRGQVEADYDKYTKEDAYLTDYNVEHKASSMDRVWEGQRAITHLPNTLNELEAKARKALAEFYDDFTVSEWIEQHVLPLKRMIDTLQRRLNTLASQSVWPRRPFEAVKSDLLLPKLSKSQEDS